MHRTLAVLVAVLTLLGVAAAAAHGDDSHHSPSPMSSAAPDGRIGVLLADHGEPPEYNEWTYESFREFFGHLIEMGIIPAWLSALDNGTVLWDEGCPACPEARDNPRLVDAWLRHHDGPAVFVPASDRLPAHYEAPGGPGAGEPDIFEHVGLSAWDEWRRMGGRSPNYDEKLGKKAEVIRRLRAAFGDRLAIRTGYGIDPRIDGGRQGIRQALDALVNRDRVGALVVAYHGVGFSDIMQTHHLRHLVAEHLETLGVDIPVRYSAPMGSTELWPALTVEKVRAELAALPPGARAAVHLSGHGLGTDMCGEYDCGADAYHASSRDLFARTKAALSAARIHDVFHVYGDGGDDENDPGDEVDSPIEALAKRKAAGYTHVIDVPYEFDSNSRDTLIVLRHGYGRNAPDWDARWVSRFRHDGIDVTITHASDGVAAKTTAYERVIRDALRGWAEPAATTAPTADPAGHGHRDAPHVLAAAHAHAGSPPDPEGGTHLHAGGMHQAPETDIDHAHAPMLHRVGADHGHDSGEPHGHGAPSGTWPLVALALAAAGGGALATGAVGARRKLLLSLVLAGVGLQLVGLAWDVVAHARDGEAVHLLENPGHWLAASGLILVGAAAARATAQRGS
ncbi:MAG TPA: hypothetical protein VHF47_13760 [Acidimicrobiales bacterium]|nr:hypothetical protein [Acidimicrobiales bacterium]